MQIECNVPKRKYFTLIELLAVIAVIAILAAVLMPDLPSLRERANASQSSSNLKTVAAASLVYDDDYKGNIPHSAILVNGAAVSRGGSDTKCKVNTKRFRYDVRT